jgi:hypothetical protein
MIFSPHSFPTTIESSLTQSPMLWPHVLQVQNLTMRSETIFYFDWFWHIAMLTQTCDVLVAVAFLFTYILSLPLTCSKLVMLRRVLAWASYSYLSPVRECISTMGWDKRLWWCLWRKENSCSYSRWIILCIITVLFIFIFFTKIDIIYTFLNFDLFTNYKY